MKPDRCYFARLVRSGFATAGLLRRRLSRHPKMRICCRCMMVNSSVARNSYVHFTSVLGCRSVGVVAVTVNECQALGLEVKSKPDRFPEHAVVDFTRLPSSGSRKDAAKQLASYAIRRDWQYRGDTG